MKHALARGAALVAALALLLAACGSDDPETASDSAGGSPTSQPSTDDQVVDTTATITSTTPMEMDDGDHDDGDHDDGEMAEDSVAEDSVAEDGATEADHTIEITYADGAVVGGPPTIETAPGAVVTLVVTSDVADEVHVHGADIHQDLSPGETVEVTFTAEIPGQFEIELEELGQLLATLVTS